MHTNNTTGNILEVTSWQGYWHVCAFQVHMQLAIYMALMYPISIRDLTT